MIPNIDPLMKKIVVIGPESTGKSSLCEQLALHYNTVWCPEYARAYLLAHGMNYSYADLLTIAKGQLDLEDRSAAALENKSRANTPPLLFIDTNMYVMKVWSEFVFGNCHQWIIDQIVRRKYDLYLLCNTDLPWVADELREYPDLKTREKLFHIYKDILVNQDSPWVEISGTEGRRFEVAVEAVERLILASSMDY